MGKESKESANKELEESPEVKESEEIEGTEGTNRIEKVEREVGNLKSDVQKISEDLKSVVADLKESIVDVRSAVSEIENPFNLLRVISSEKDLKKLNSQRGARAMPSGTKSLILGKAEKKEVAKPAKPTEEEELPTEEVPQFEVEEREEEEERVFRLPLPKTGLGYLDWVWSLLESGLNPQDIADLARCYELLGYLPASSSNWIFSLAHAAQKARSRKLDKDYLLLTMYKAATISGIEIGLEDARELVCIAERKKNRVQKGKTDRVRKGKTDRVRKRA